MSAGEQQVESAEPDWVSLPDEQLLDLRICDLKLRIPGTELSKCVSQLGRELKSHGLVFRPAYMVVGRLVFSRWCAWARRPVLYGASAIG